MSKIKVNASEMKSFGDALQRLERFLRDDAEKVSRTAGSLRISDAAVQVIKERIRDTAGEISMRAGNVADFGEALKQMAAAYENTEKKNAGLFDPAKALADAAAEAADRLPRNTTIEEAAASVWAAVEAFLAALNDYFRRSSRVNLADDRADADGRKSDGRSYDGDPVNMATGVYVDSRTYLKMYSGMPLAFSLYYHSAGFDGGMMGKGWKHSYELSVQDAGGKKYVILEDGHKEVFLEEEDGSLTNALGRSSTLVQQDGGYLYRTNLGDCYRFDRDGRICSVSDRNGNGVSMFYDEQNRLAEVCSRENAGYRLSYGQDGLLEEVRDSAGRCLRFLHEGGLLVAVTDENGAAARFSYNERGILASKVNALGELELGNEYDGQGRVTSQTLAGGGRISYEYEDGAMIMTQPDGSRIRYRSDERLRNTETVYENGTETVSYNDRNQKISFTDRNGARTEYGYDVSGNLTQILTPAGGKYAFEYNSLGQVTRAAVNGFLYQKKEYDDLGNLVAQEDGLGRRVVYERDEAGRPVHTILPDGQDISMEFTAGGRLASVSSPGHGITQYEYDAAGDLQAFTDPSGSRTEIRRDGRGRPVEIRNAAGQVQTISYNAAGHAVSMTDFGGARTQVDYNAAGRPIRLTDPDGGTTRLFYNAMSQLEKRVDPEGGETLYAYDRMQNLVGVTSPGGAVTRYEYDAAGNRTATIFPDGGRLEIAYDGLNRPVKMTEPTGLVTKYTYHYLGKVMKIEDSAGRVEQFGYDAAGQLVRHQDKKGYVTTYAYDAMGNEIRETDAAGRTWEFFYENGHLVRSEDPAGYTETYTYDLCGRLSTRRSGNGSLFRYVYDVLGRVIEVFQGEKRIRSYSYDAAGNIAAVTDALGNISRYEYSAGSRLLGVTDALGGRISYRYNRKGELVEILRRGGADEAEAVHEMNQARRTLITRTPDGDAASVTDPLGLADTYELDGMRRVVRHCDRDGFVTSFTYEPDGQLKTRTYDDGRSVEYRYDAMRLLYELEDWTGITRIERNEKGDITGITAPDGNHLSVELGEAGERRALVYPDGRRFTYDYDSCMRLAKISTEGGDIRWRYGTAGLLEEKILPNGISSHYTYNEDRQLVRLLVEAEGKPLQDFRYTYDDEGLRCGTETLRTDLPQENGRYSYAYDALHRLVRVSKDEELLRAYVYDDFGNRIRLETPDAEVRYGYNAADQLVLEEGSFGRKTRTYDGRGNLTGISDSEGSLYEAVYGGDGRPARARNRQGRSSSYLYNGFGCRTAETVAEPDGTVRELSLFYDLTEKNPPLLSCLEALGEEKHTVSYLWDGVPAAEFSGAGTAYYLQDERGSILGSTGPEGKVHSSWSYDEFGCLKADSRPAFGFTGYRTERLEAGGELMYDAGYRGYLPAIGQFAGRDRFKGSLGVPASSWEYLYCHGSPLDLVDPDGQKWEARWLRQKFEAAGDYISKTANDAYEYVTDTAQDMYDTAHDVYDYAVEKGRQAYNTVTDTVDTVISNGRKMYENAYDTYRYVKDGQLVEDIKYLHYNRNVYNRDLPQTAEEAEKMGWSDDVASTYHQFTAEDGQEHRKYVSPDGKREVIYDASGTRIITAAEDRGTYNYCPSDQGDGLLDKAGHYIGHFILDVAPYYILGNSEDDTTPWYARILGPKYYHKDSPKDNGPYSPRYCEM